MKISTYFSRAALLSVLTMVLAFNSVNAQVPTDSIVADFNEFVRLLEETHPDPYTNYGGRPFFRKAAMETRYGLVEDSVTSPDELARRINEFLAPLSDGHTYVRGGYGNMMDAKKAFIRFNTMNEGIIWVEALPAEYENLLGSKLVAIENMPVQDVVSGLAKIYSAENEVGRRFNLCEDRGFMVDLDKVITNLREDSITYHLETPTGQQVSLTLPRLPLSEIRSTPFCRPSHSDQFPNKDLAFDFVDQDKNTMYLRLHSIMARDCFEYMRDNGWDYQDQLRRMYWGKDMPSDPDEAIAQLPSFSEEFEKMLLQMKKNGSKNLIIDLRGNSGGFTPISIPTLYQMWGDRYILESSNINTDDYQMVSPLLMKKRNTTLEQVNAEGPMKVEFGDYWFSDREEPITKVTPEIRNKFLSWQMSSVKDHLIAQNGKPVYTPEHIYVLTDPGTFSAGFHYAFFLWKMGATLVGVPCSQAPNTYMEATPFELPRTGLKGHFSNTLQMFLPADDPRAKEFTPDLMPTYEDYKRYNFDDNTIPMYLMDIINKKK